MKLLDYLGHSLGSKEVVVLSYLLRFNGFRVSWEISVEEWTEFIFLINCFYLGTLSSVDPAHFPERHFSMSVSTT